MFNKNFKIILSTESLSSIGFGFYSIATMMLVLEITGNAFYSGLAFFVTGIAPCVSFLISPLSNYFHYKKGLIYSQLTQAILLATIPILYYLDQLHVFYLLSVMFVVSLINQFIYPIQNTIIPIIVGKDNILKANSIMTVLRESLNITFYGLAGIVVISIGSSYTFIITVVCFSISAVIYTGLKNLYYQPSKIHSKNYLTIIKKYREDLKEGIRFIQNSIIPHFIFGSILLNLFCGIMIAVIPAYGVSLGGEHFLGFFMLAFTSGMLIGSVIAPKLKLVRFGLINIFGSILSGFFWIITPFFLNFISVIMFGLGFIFIGAINVLIFSTIQANIETEMRGRVITVISSFSAMSLPVGSLAGGYLATIVGNEFPIMMGGIGMIAFSLYWTLHPYLRVLPNFNDLVLFKRENTEIVAPLKVHNKEV